MGNFTTVDDRGRVLLDTELDAPTGCTVAYYYSLRSHYHEAELRWRDGASETVNRDHYGALREAVNDILVGKGGYGPWTLAVVIRLGSLAQEKVYLRRSAHGDWDTVPWVVGVAPPNRDHYTGDHRWLYTEFDGDTLPARCKAYGYDAVALPWDPALGAALDAYMLADKRAHGRMVDLLNLMVDRSRLPQVQEDGDESRVPTFLLNLVRAERDILAAGEPGSRAHDLTVALSDLLVAMHDRARWGDGIPDELIPLVGDVAERAGLPVVWWDDAEMARRYVVDGMWVARQYDRWRRGKFAHLVPVRADAEATVSAATLAMLPTSADFINDGATHDTPAWEKRRRSHPQTSAFLGDGPTHGDLQSPSAHTLRPKTEEGN